MKGTEIFLLLMSASVVIILFGRLMGFSYPIALVLGGLGISLIPGLPLFEMEPEMVFLLILPPLLFSAGWMTSWHDFKAHLRPILLLAGGLVLFTAAGVAFVICFFIPSMPFAVAFVLGALVSPPDAVAATALAQQMRLPKRVVSILEGESLVNDATGLVALRFAVVAVVTGTFSFTGAMVQFSYVAIGGVLLGLALAWLMVWIIRKIHDDSLLLMVTLLMPYAVYLPAERLHVSGVLAAVTAGIYMGHHAAPLLSANMRINAAAVWDVVVLLLNITVFVLIGLQLPQVMDGLDEHYSFKDLLFYAVIVCATVVILRPIWVFPATYLPHWLNPNLKNKEPVPPWTHVALISWCGMRGGVSLAAALAMPLALNDGSEFPYRSMIIFLTFAVILVTLVFQGMTMPWLARKLRVEPESVEMMEKSARQRMTDAALNRLAQIEKVGGIDAAAFRIVQQQYDDRKAFLTDELAEQLGWSQRRVRTLAVKKLRRSAINAERQELHKIRREREIEESLVRQMERELDLDETRLKG